MEKCRLVLAQLNLTVGDIQGNSDKIIAAAQRAHQEMGADILALPEQAIIGYPAEDLILQPDMASLCRAALQRILAEIPPQLCIVIGYPRDSQDAPSHQDPLNRITNHLEVYHQGKLLASYAKQLLPSYQVFDEKRYFKAGKGVVIFKFKGIKFGVLICEDLWQEQPVADCKKSGAQHIISINASPYSTEQPQKRVKVVQQRARENDISISYVNCCGGQDELVFDGNSFVCNNQGEVVHRAPGLCQHLSVVEIDAKEQPGQPLPAEIHQPLEKNAEIYEVLKLGLRDYMHKNNFSKAVLGLSGGIDSAVVACLAADALGAQNVTCLMMPYNYTSNISLEDAAVLANNLGVNYESIAVHPLVDTLRSSLGRYMDLSDPTDITAQNIQPRARAIILMAWANKNNMMVLATSNKSESAVGYTTLYGDMAGGYSPLKDVFKTRVYQLAEYRNSISAVIPARAISRPPTAELYEGQQDVNNLPEYDVLDKILTAYVEEAMGHNDIIQRGFSRADVIRVINMVDKAEYKRQQAAPGTRISERGFGKDRRYPITNKYAAELQKA